MKARHAIIVTFAERYFSVGMNFLVTAVVARLLTPEDFGLVAIGVSILGVVETIRDFGISNYLVQRKELTRETARTGFSVIAIISLAIGAGLFFAANSISEFYNEARLIPYIHVMAAVALTGVFSSPLMALMRRDMAFTSIAIVNLSATLVVAAVTVGLAASGFRHMSYAWAALAGSVTYAVLSMLYRPDFWIFWPAFRDWRSALAFGSYSSLSDTLSRGQDLLTYLILGGLMPTNAVGLYNRASFVSGVPLKLLMVGVMPVALPGFAMEARAERHLKQPYLQALSSLTAVLWPSLVLLALVGHPAVLIVLGSEWLSVVPVVQILAIATLASAPLPLTFPVLSAVGGIKQGALMGLVTVPVNLLILLVAAPFGLHAVAWSAFITVALQSAVSLWLVQRYVPFRWGELVMALRKSALVTLYSAAAPVFVIAALGFRFDISISVGIVIGLLAAVGWLAGLWMVNHPLFSEVQEVTKAVRVRLGTLPAGSPPLTTSGRKHDYLPEEAAMPKKGHNPEEIVAKPRQIDGPVT